MKVYAFVNVFLLSCRSIKIKSSDKQTKLKSIYFAKRMLVVIKNATLGFFKNDLDTHNSLVYLVCVTITITIIYY